MLFYNNLQFIYFKLIHDLEAGQRSDNKWNTSRSSDTGSNRLERKDSGSWLLEVGDSVNQNFHKVIRLSEEEEEIIL